MFGLSEIQNSLSRFLYISTRHSQPIPNDLHSQISMQHRKLYDCTTGRMRIHFSHDEIGEIRSIKTASLAPKAKHSWPLRPKGLWYALNDTAWTRYVDSLGEQGRYPRNRYKYSVHLAPGCLTRDLERPSKDKILQIATLNELHRFHQKYSVRPPGFMESKFARHMFKHRANDAQLIDWRKVMRDFGGFELRLDPAKRRKHFADGMADFWWVDVLDIPSGCVWSAHLMRLEAMSYNKKIDKGPRSRFFNWD